MLCNGLISTWDQNVVSSNAVLVLRLQIGRGSDAHYQITSSLIVGAANSSIPPPHIWSTQTTGNKIIFSTQSYQKEVQCFQVILSCLSYIQYVKHSGRGVHQTKSLTLYTKMTGRGRQLGTEQAVADNYQQIHTIQLLLMFQNGSDFRIQLTQNTLLPLPVNCNSGFQPKLFNPILCLFRNINSASGLI